MKLKLLIIIGVLSAFVAGCVLIPATAVENLVNQRLGAAGVGSFRATSGTIWAGTGIFYLSTPATSPHRASQLEIPLNWSFVPSGLLALRATFDIATNAKSIKGTARIGAGLTQLDMSHANLATSLDVVSRFSPNLALLRASGDMKIHSGNDSFKVDYAAPHKMNGQLRVVATDVRIRTIWADPFGSYEARLVFAEQNVRYQIDHATGMLNLKGEGNVSLAAPRQFRYNGMASVSRTAPVWLSVALLAVGRPTLDGRYNIDYKINF